MLAFSYMSQAFVILASQSPRRAQLLRQMQVGFTAVAADIDESPRPGEAARDYVLRMAHAKADHVARRKALEHPVLGADTAVVVDDQIFGKPTDADDAARMLSALSGRTHEVLSAVAVVTRHGRLQTVTSTRVHMRKITQHEIASYWRSGEPADKAGAYAIQGRGAMFVEGIDGSYSGVVGLPLAQTAALLEQSGLDLWPEVSAA